MSGLGSNNGGGPENPTQRYYEWSGSQAKWKYFDKSIGAKGENVFIDEPMYIVPLDVLTTIKGFHEGDSKGIYSNEVHNKGKETLNVKSFAGTEIAKGIYADIKDVVKSAGGKFCSSVYAGLVTGSGQTLNVELVNFQFFGSSLSPIIEAGKVLDVKHGTKWGEGLLKGDVIQLSTDSVEKKKGSNTYYEPVLKTHDKSEEAYAIALELNTKLQSYLAEYTATKATENSEQGGTPPVNIPVNVTTSEPAEEEDNLPF